MRVGTTHILYNPSAAASLRRALTEDGCDDRVLHLSDDLSCGSIASLDPDRRLEALVAMGLAERREWDWLPEVSRDFWAAAASDAGRRVIWLAPRSAPEMAGFLAYMHRFADRPCELIDTDEHREQLRRLEGLEDHSVLYLSALWPHHFRAMTDWARPVTADDAAAAGRLWSSLTEEDAPLRVPHDGGMISCADTHLDDAILQHCTPDWRRSIRIIGGAAGTIWDRGYAAHNFHFLGWRLVRLVAEGVLESERPLTRWIMPGSDETRLRLARP